MNGMQKAVVKNMNWANDVPTYQVTGLGLWLGIGLGLGLGLG